MGVAWTASFALTFPVALAFAFGHLVSVDVCPRTQTLVVVDASCPRIGRRRKRGDRILVSPMGGGEFVYVVASRMTPVG